LYSALCALLHKFHPDKIPFDTLSAADPKKNYELGNTNNKFDEFILF